MRYDELRDKALNEVKIGGNIAKAEVLAVLAVAEALHELDISAQLEGVSQSITLLADSFPTETI